MRRARSEAEIYAWWRAALAGLRPAVHEDEPQCGWFRTRLVRLGPWCPARVWLHQVIDPETGELAEDERLLCEVDGDRRNPARAWISIASNPITEVAFDELVAARNLNPQMRASMTRFDLTLSPARP